jgi:TRAP-type uncharacterized transport system substrate-binding protein
MKYTATALIASLLFASAWASKPVTSGDDAPSASPNALKIATGPDKKGYANLYKDLKAVCTDMDLSEVRSNGGLDNLSILSNKKADIGFAQLDTIKDMSPGDEAIANLKAVAVLNYNYLHVLTSAQGYAYSQGREWYGAKKDDQVVRITKFSDLKGRTVALVGSAQLMVTAMQQRSLKDYNMRFIEAKDDATAAQLVTTGKAQAMMTVSGAPSGFVGKLTTANGLAMVPFDEDLGGVYVVRKLNYKNIGAFNVKAAAVPNVLMTRDFGAKKASQVAALRQCIIDNLQDLKDGEYEPAWNEARLDAQVDLPKFVAPAAPTKRK